MDPDVYTSSTPRLCQRDQGRWWRLGNGDDAAASRLLSQGKGRHLSDDPDSGTGLQVPSRGALACAPSTYLLVIVLTVVGHPQQGAVVAPKSLPARGDVKLLQLLQLRHGSGLGGVPWGACWF